MDDLDMDAPMTPAELTHLRKKSGMTQTDMAKELGLTLRGYQKLESGESPMRINYEKAAQFTVIERIAAGTPSDDAAINDLVLRAWHAINASEDAKWGVFAKIRDLLNSRDAITRNYVPNQALSPEDRPVVLSIEKRLAELGVNPLMLP